MEAQAERIELPFTYTYDQFTVFFHGDHVFVGGQDFPMGQCCVDVMNLDETVLTEIEQRALALLPPAQALLREKTDRTAASAQEKLNAVWDVIFALPVYRELRMDEACNYHTFERLMAGRERWAQVLDPASEGRAAYLEMLEGPAGFAEDLRAFRQQVEMLTALYFEPLKRRNSGAYAQAYSYFYGDMVVMTARVLQEDFQQSASMEVSFVPILHPTEEGQVFVAEKATFRSPTDFLWTEFYRGLALGNAPRRCHNCGTYFLLTAGYNTCYCNNVAPGETERTCRKVGAHRKESQGKANQTPAQRKYDRTYNRPKARKQRGRVGTLRRPEPRHCWSSLARCS